jgi:hypothetical protein
MYEFRAKQEDVALSVWQRLWQKIMASPAAILLVLAAILCFVANHLLVVTDPVESNYVLTAKEMLASGDYFSPRIFGDYWYDKPIFFYWELIAAFKLFGISNFSARFFPALFGMAGILLAYGFTARLYDKKTGFLTGLILLTTVEYFYLSKAIITDMTLFVFYSACLMAFYIAYSEGKPRWYYLAYAFAGPGRPDQRAYRLLPARADHPAFPRMAPGSQGPAAHQALFRPDPVPGHHPHLVWSDVRHAWQRLRQSVHRRP